jgi:predicted Rossmann fold nucleotide-binding protein DprA/Smf involved in DNA uptake
MQAFIRVLRQRVRDSRYVVDEGAVAEAVLARARPRLNADRANARKRLARLEQQIKQFRVENRGADAPARSVRRATARRASARRATARRRRHDPTAPIMEFLNKHPQSTAGDLAKSLNLDPESVSTSLNKLVIAGNIDKHAHGYSAAS